MKEEFTCLYTEWGNQTTHKSFALFYGLANKLVTYRYKTTVFSTREKVSIIDCAHRNGHGALIGYYSQNDIEG